VGYIVDYYSTPISIWPITGVAAATCVEAEDPTGDKNLYFDGYDGITYKFDSGNADGSAAINAYYETSKMKIDKFPYLKKIQQVQTYLKQTGNYNVTLSFRIDDINSYTDNTINLAGGGDKLGSTFILGTSKLAGQSNITAVNDIPQVMNNIQFKITANDTNPKTVLYGVDLIGEPEGIGN
jgi:hypothetical protein